MDVRNLTANKAAALVEQHNKLRADIARASFGLVLHSQAVPSTVPEVDPEDLTASTNALVAAYAEHIGSAFVASTNLGAHGSADTTNTIAAPVATNLATSITRANELKADLNLHIGATAKHMAASSAAVAAANATDAPSLKTLLDDIAAVLAAHVESAFASEKITIVAA